MSRNNISVTKDKKEVIYQSFIEKTNYFISTITFDDVAMEDAGFYHCILMKSDSVLKSLRLTVEGLFTQNN